ncbi:MAG TPA: PilN domain-containing protein [Rhizomicrobium sp.]|jgi:Tfp pilus assembly protein PilN|nr:PilN domain-containing protein [Rhizomicrobium sp.]
MRDLLERVLAFWRWWLGELASLVPPGLRTAFSGGNDAILIEVQDSEFLIARRAGAFETVIARVPRDEYAGRTLRLSTAEKSGLAAWFADPVILQMPVSDALGRALRLPRAARRDLDGILRHEVVRQSPIAAPDIYYDYRVAGSDADALDVDLRIVRREPVDACIALCHGAGIALSAIEFTGDGAHADGGTFPADPHAARRLRWQPHVVPLLFGLILLLGAGLVMSLYLRGAAVAADLDARVDAARDKAMVVERLQQQLDAANRQATFLAKQKTNPAAVAVLASVARLLPDNAWLYEFERNGDEVRLHGFSAQAASLIALFDASPFFGEAQMRSPLMQGPTNALQRFDISFKLRRGAS